MQVLPQKHVEWRPVLDGYYEVSEYGQVRRLKPAKGATVGQLIKPYIIPWSGYAHYNLYVGHGKKKSFFASRLVALAFIGKPPTPRHEADHRNDDIENNHHTNIQWLTKSANVKKRNQRPKRLLEGIK